MFQTLSSKPWADPEGGGGTGGPDPPGKSQVAIGFLRNTSMDPPREAIGPKGSNCLLTEVLMALCEVC